MMIKKTPLAAALAMAVGAGGAQAANIAGFGTAFATTGNNFTMISPIGGLVGGTNDVNATWDGSIFTASSDYTGPGLPGSFANMTLSSDQAFFGYTWQAKDIQVFGPGSYKFSVIEAVGNVKMTVGSGELGAHMLFDWGAANSTTPCGLASCDIDVVNVWQQGAVFGPSPLFTGADNGTSNTGGALDGSPNTAGVVWSLMSEDNNGDGFNGTNMKDGAFSGFNANFNLSAGTSAVPVPPAVWLFGSGLLGLVGVARRKAGK